MVSEKGTGKAGGSLKARVAAWSAEKPRNGNGSENVVHHRPGSQNPRKGAVARGRRRVEEFH